MKTPKISVVMPAYNHELYVAKAIESVLAQTFGDFEFIVVNDGSTDNTLSIIESYKDSRLTLINQSNQDAFNAINNGMSKATGDYIAIINSDDVYHHERLEQLYRLALTGSYGFLFSGLNYIDSAGRHIGTDDPRQRTYQRLLSLYEKTGDIGLVMMSGNLVVTTSNFFIASGLAERVGRFSPYRYCHDYDYFFRVMRLGAAEDICFTRDCLLGYRLHGKNTVLENSARVIGETIEVLENFGAEQFACQYDREMFNLAIIPKMKSMARCLDDMTATTSWRITKPLRNVRRLVRGIRARLS